MCHWVELGFVSKAAFADLKIADVGVMVENCD
jgi:hypothetical protein